ncbi:MAG: glycosyltransferase family 39 protein [Candidatus Micrarchaeota archaeon]|nr:glycosyltransferase family 39 protein [Candidatus Micrarchaeota archaeon]
MGKSTLRSLYSLLLKRKAYILLAAVVVMGLLMSFYYGYNYSYDGYDDFYYALYAHTVQQYGFGALPFSAFSVKYVLIGALAVSYSLFGFSMLSNALFSLACFVGLVIVAYFIGAVTGSERRGLIAAFFVSTLPLILLESGTGGDSMPAAFFSALCVLLLLLGLRRKKRLPLLFSGFVSVAGVLAGGLVSLMVLPFAILMLAYAAWKRETAAWGNVSFLSGVVLALLLLVLLGEILTGSPLAYFAQTFSQGVIANSYSHEANVSANLIWYASFFFPYFQQALVPAWPSSQNTLLNSAFAIITRAYVSVPSYGYNYSGYLGILFLVGLAYVFMAGERRLYPIALWFAVVFGYLSAGTVTPFSYAPPAFNERFVIVLAAPACVLAAYPVERLLSVWMERRRKVPMRAVAGFLAVAALAVVLGNSVFTAAYAGYANSNNLFQEIEVSSFLQSLPSNATIYIVSGFYGNGTPVGVFGSPLDLNNIEALLINFYTGYGHRINDSLTELGCNGITPGSYFVFDKSIWSLAAASPYALITNCSGMRPVLTSLEPPVSALQVQWPGIQDRTLSVYRYA